MYFVEGPLTSLGLTKKLPHVFHYFILFVHLHIIVSSSTRKCSCFPSTMNELIRRQVALSVASAADSAFHQRYLAVRVIGLFVESSKEGGLDIVRDKKYSPRPYIHTLYCYEIIHEFILVVSYHHTIHIFRYFSIYRIAYV